MISNTVFTWGWKDYPRQPDTLMSRARMARLMRCWRKAKTQGRREFNLQCLSRKNGCRVYAIHSNSYDDAATFEILQKVTQ